MSSSKRLKFEIEIALGSRYADNDARINIRVPKQIERAIKKVNTLHVFETESDLLREIISKGIQGLLSKLGQAPPMEFTNMLYEQSCKAVMEAHEFLNGGIQEACHDINIMNRTSKRRATMLMGHLVQKLKSFDDVEARNEGWHKLPDLIHDHTLIPSDMWTSKEFLGGFMFEDDKPPLQ